MKINLIVIAIFVFFASSLAQTDTSIVRLLHIDSTIVTDVRYATKNNFTGKILYPDDKVFIRKIVGDSLAKANQYLIDNYDLRIKIFDAFRPLSVQKQMWEILPDNRYVADPAKGSRHNRGAAVDITLIDSTGTQLDMGTGYDNFTKKAHFAYADLSDNQRRNRDLLRETMMKFGFEPITSEWWHFDFKGWKRFAILENVPR